MVIDRINAELQCLRAKLCRIQTERQERKRVKQELGLEEEPGRKTRFDPPEPVASGISLGIKPTPAGTAAGRSHCYVTLKTGNSGPLQGRIHMIRR